jgi:predicted TIM-barrel fold metal-dependent hydrolase
LEIIDTHIHIFSGDHARDMARRAGHENSYDHLREEYARLGIVGAVVMGNRTLEPEAHSYPANFRYCVGLDSSSLWQENLRHTYDMVEANLKRTECVGVKLYAGYVPYYVYDGVYGPVYELAERYDKPVAIHTGETASPGARLRYCHPLTLDEAAASHPRVRFVMCHLGNPWIVDAAAVLSKNKNVSADLSGMLVGLSDMPEFFEQYKGYIEHLSTWIAYINDYDQLMYATDWPLANMGNYIDFVARIIPEKHHEKVFAANARRIYKLDL